MTSLRQTIIASLLAALAALAGAGGTSAYLSTRAETSEMQDLQQMQIARFVGDLSMPQEDHPPLGPHDPEDDYVVAVRRPSIGLDRATSTSPVLPEAVATGFTTIEEAGTTWRVYSLVWDDDDRTVQVAQQTTVRDELAQEAALRATLPFVLALPLTALVVELVTRVAFRRLDRLARSIEARADDDLSALRTADVPAEVRTLVLAINDLLERLRGALQRERNFLADAAHELRTPLTALGLQIDNLRRRSTLEDDATVRDLTNGVTRATALSEQLLRLARAERGEVAVPYPLVRLDAVALDAVAAVMPLAERRSIDLGVVRNDAVKVRGSSDDLRVLIEVLLANAVRHAPEGGTVDVELRADPGREIVLSVLDDGPGVPEALLPRLGERFYRASREADGGSGLGLAIAQAIARRHGGCLLLANRPDRPGFCASLIVEASTA